jgi:hypothetical protein
MLTPFVCRRFDGRWMHSNPHFILSRTRLISTLITEGAFVDVVATLKPQISKKEQNTRQRNVPKQPF